MSSPLLLLTPIIEITMASVQDYLNQIIPTEAAPAVTPVTPNAADAAALAQAQNDPMAALTLNTAMDQGNTLATDNQIINDFQNIPLSDFSRKYGSDILQQMTSLAAGQQEVSRLNVDGRTTGQHLTDAASGAVKGLVGGLGDAATLVGGAVNRDAGRFLSNTTTGFRNWMDETTQSESNNTNRFMSSLRADLDGQDNAKQYAKDQKTQSSFMAGLKYLGRGFVNGAYRFYEDPQSLETGLTEGVGSLLAGGPLAKGLGIAGKLAGLGERALAATMPASIGLMEGGSAYTGAMQEVMGMSHEELLQTSPTYRDAILSGKSPDEAKDLVASRAAEIAGAVQAPIGALTGKLVAGFEAHPLGSKGFRDMVKNIVHETTEEGLQSASGQLAQNLGVQQADQNKSLLEGVGDQTAQGAILGGLTAGVVQAPSVPKVTLKNAVDALKARATEVNTTNEEASGVTQEQVLSGIQTAKDNIEPVAEAVSKLNETLPEEVKTEISQKPLGDRLKDIFNYNPEEIKKLGENIPKYMIDNGIQGAQNNLDFTTKIASVAYDENVSQEDRTKAGLFVLNQIEKVNNLFGEDLDEAKTGLKQDSDEYQAISSFQKQMENLKNLPSIKQALEWAKESAKVEVSDAAPVTPDTVNAATLASTAQPSSLGSKGARTILKQADEGKVTLTPEQRKVLRNTEVTMQIAEQADARIAESNKMADPLTDTVKDVADQIANRGMDNGWALSLNQHVARFNTAIQDNDMAAANGALRGLGNFARSQVNKANAWVRSADVGGTQEYTPVGPYGRNLPKRPAVFHANSERSKATGRQIIIEANALVDQFNALADANPEVPILDENGNPRRLSRVREHEAFFDQPSVVEENKAPQEAQAAQQSEPREETANGVVTQETPSLDAVVEKEQQPTPQPEDTGPTTAVETVAETTAQPNKSAVEQKFPFLVVSKEGHNRFAQTFSAETTGRFLEYGEPIVEFRDALNSNHVLENFDILDEEANALQAYLNKGLDLIYGKGIMDPEKGLFGGLIDRFNAFANLPLSKKTPNGEKFKNKIMAGDDIAGSRRGHALAIMEKIGNRYRYNPALLQTAVLAALNWMASSQNRKSLMDKETLSKSLGVDMSKLSNSKVEEFNAGVGLTQAVRSLAEEINRFWGMKTLRDAPENLAKGIPEAIAKEILGAMEAQGWMTSEMLKIPGDDRDFKQYYFEKTENNEQLYQLLHDMGPAKKLIEQAGLREVVSEDASFIPHDPKTVARTQMRNPAVKNTPYQIGVLRKAEAIAHTFYQNGYDLQRAITADGWINMMGSKKIDGKTPFNIEHEKSIKGKNLTIQMAFDAMEQQYKELVSFARENGLDDIQAINKYYRFNYSRVNRLQMLGANNPQSDKIARHVWLPTKRTIDMTDDTSKAAVGFWMSIAQGLGDAKGWKPQHHTPAENAAYGRSLVEGEFAPFVDELVDWLSDKEGKSLLDWSARLRDAAPGITEHGVMSLLSAAEYKAAPDLSKFTTHNYFEADGVTNGAANALMNLTTRVTASWVNAIQKAGAFLGKPGENMTSQKGVADLYQSAGDTLAHLQKEMARNLPADSKEIYDSLFRMMRGLGMKIEFQDNGEIKIGRKVLKNPLTITIYGSGVDGIAGNVASEMMGAFYEALSDHMQARRNSSFGDDMVYDGKPYSSELFWQDFAKVIGTRVISENNEYKTLSAVGAKKFVRVPTNAELKNISISPNEFRVLQGNVRALMVDNMAKAIRDTVMTHVGGMVDTIQKSSNAQSIVMTTMFKRAMVKLLNEKKKRPDYRAGDFLSREEIEGIVKRLMPYGAVINTGTQSFFLGSGERGNLGEGLPEAFSRSLFDDMNTSSYVYGPGIAGVSVVPSLNIGVGDGRTIDIFLHNLGDYGVLPVFDGINLPVDRVFEASEAANAAVAQSWTENPAKHVADGYRAWMALNPLEQLFDPTENSEKEIQEFATEMTKNIFGVRKIDEALTRNDIQQYLDNYLTQLTVGQQQIADRIAATKVVGMSVDQMAGAMSPAQQKGSVELPAKPSDAQIAAEMDRQIRIAAMTRNAGEIVSGPNREFVRAFASKASVDPDTGAMVADVTMLDAIRKTLNNKLSNANREMLNASLTALADSGLKLVYGTAEMVDRYEQTNYPNTYHGDTDSFLGKIDVENNVIYLTNPSVETLTHELLHAATIHKMLGFYRDPKSVSVTDGEAITRMEGLMNEWLTRSYEREGPVSGEAHRMAMSAIVSFLNQGKKAEALNEFLAWSLTNANIANLQKKMQVQNPLYTVIGKALTALKQLIWGNKKAPALGNDMFNNVKFNARVLMATPTPLELFQRDYADVVMHQSAAFGADPRLSDVRKRFGEHMVSFVRTAQTNDPVKNAAQFKLRKQAALDALLRHARVAQWMANPFGLNMQQMSTFKMIGATLATAEHLNSASLTRMQDVFDTFLDKIKVEDFLHNDGRDEGLDRVQAQAKYDALHGVGVTVVDDKGRSSLLSNFLALATVDDHLREILRGMSFPAKVMDKSWKPDALIDRAQSAVASGLANYASGLGKGEPDLLAAMEALTENLIENVGDQRSFIEQRIDNGLDNADNIIKTYIEKGAKKVQDWATTVQNPIGSKAARFLSAVSKSLTNEGTKSLTRAGVMFMNQPEIKNAQREAYNEVIGRTDENAPIFDMITRTRTLVDQTRQRWREEYPRELRKRFSRKLDAAEWGSLHHALGQTDAGVLVGRYGKARTLELLSLGSERATEIRALEHGLSAPVIAKAKQLANFMMTGDHGQMLQPNAYAIANLNGHQDRVQDIDSLVTLYALDNLSETARDNLENLIENETDGFEKVLASLVSTRNDEMAKAVTTIAKMNLNKGHLPGQSQEGVHLVIDSRQNHAKYMSMGYTDLGNYNGSTADVGTDQKAYYFAPVSGRAKFNQGVMQTVQQSVFGVNPDTGYSVGSIGAGRVTDPRAVNAITRRIQNQLPTTENLRPIYGDNGRVIAYERAADPAKLAMLNPEYDLAQALGSWRGRQSEEQASQTVNEALVDRVFEQWTNGRMEGRTNEFVDMSRSSDPIIADAWSVIPRETKEYIKAKFGQDGFRVRRDQLLDVAGARSATVGDFWTGNSRWSPAVQKEIKDLIMGFAGNKAYGYLVNAESFFQQVVTDAKVMIVIKSVFVPAINYLSNVYQLSMNGVPVRNIFKGFKEKTYELNTYIKMKEQERQLQDDLFVAEGNNDGVAVRKLSTRIRSIQDAYKAMSIHTLIEAGEFGAITDGNLSAEDMALAKGGYQAFVERMISKLPNDGSKDAARYAMVTRDTSLFKLLSRATQYGDFLGKAVLYDDLMRRKGMTQAEALAYVNEEFVNYNRFAGRNRAYLESMGLTWFYHFKIRSMKMSQRMMQNHPLRALLHTAIMPRIPLLGTIGNPLTDNFLSIALDGGLGRSLGPGQLLRVPQLNPWVNIIN